MIRILLVDDDHRKTERVLAVLNSIRGFDTGKSVETVQNAFDAKARLRLNRYDLLILDIALPDKANGSPVSDGGVKLLDELAKRTVYKKPREIIG